MADTLLGGIVFNEVMADPNSVVSASGAHIDTDNSGTVTPVDEFIEIKNTSATAINIGGMQLWDQAIGNYFTFPAGTILQPGAHAMVMTGANAGTGAAHGGSDLTFYAGRGAAVLNNGAENTILYDPGSLEYVQIAYGGAGIVTPTGASGSFPGFPSGTTRVGAGEVLGTTAAGTSFQRVPDGTGSFSANQVPTAANTNVCFVSGNLIATPSGERLVEDLRVGDLVVTASGAARPILWIGSRHIPAAELCANPKLWPVRLLAGSLGNGLPRRSLRLSRQHRVAISGLLRQSSALVLVPAVSLVEIDGIDCVMPMAGVTYIHLLLAEHSVLLAEGAEVESLYLGREAAHALGIEAMEEIGEILGLTGDFDAGYPAALPMLKAGEAQRAIRRHQRSGSAFNA